MKTVLQAGLASAALGFAALAAAPAVAADLGNYDYKGSIKDTYVPGPASSSHCYFKAGLGYSWSQDPSVEWGATLITSPSLDNSWLGQAGLGCSQGDRGFRAELEFAYRGKKDFQGDVIVPNVPNDPAHTSIQTSTMMVNAYYNLGNWHNVVPYVGAGVGFAYNRMSEVYFTGNPPAFTGRVVGKDTLTAAWSLMAGAEVKVTDRMSLDFGYRYIDFGLAESDHGGIPPGWNPRFTTDDLRAHEFLVGVRYKFCSTCR